MTSKSAQPICGKIAFCLLAENQRRGRLYGFHERVAEPDCDGQPRGRSRYAIQHSYGITRGLDPKRTKCRIPLFQLCRLRLRRDHLHLRPRIVRGDRLPARDFRLRFLLRGGVLFQPRFRRRLLRRRVFTDGKGAALNLHRQEIDGVFPRAADWLEGDDALLIRHLLHGHIRHRLPGLQIIDQHRLLLRLLVGATPFHAGGDGFGAGGKFAHFENDAVRAEFTRPGIDA